MTQRAQPIERKVTDGTRCDAQMAGLPIGLEAYAHPGGIVSIYDPWSLRHADIEVVGMTASERERAVIFASRVVLGGAQ